MPSRPRPNSGTRPYDRSGEHIVAKALPPLVERVTDPAVPETALSPLERTVRGWRDEILEDLGGDTISATKPSSTPRRGARSFSRRSTPMSSSWPDRAGEPEVPARVPLSCSTACELWRADPPAPAPRPRRGRAASLGRPTPLSTSPSLQPGGSFTGLDARHVPNPQRRPRRLWLVRPPHPFWTASKPPRRDTLATPWTGQV
jgi:hypothetical protein